MDASAHAEADPFCRSAAEAFDDTLGSTCDTWHGRSYLSSPPPRSPNASGYLKTDVDSHDDQMQDFVHAHLTSILNPALEEIGELKTSVGELQGKLAIYSSQVMKNCNRLDEHANELTNVSTGLAAKDSRLQTMHQLLLSYRVENSELRSNEEATKASLGRAEEKILAINSQVQTLQQLQDTMRLDLRKFGKDIQNIDRKTLDTVDNRLENLHTFCRDIHTGQKDLNDVVSQVQGAERELEDRLTKLSSLVTEHRQDALDNLSSSRTRFQSLEAKVSANAKGIDRSALNIKALEQEVQHLNSKTSLLFQSKDATARLIQEILDSSKETTRRLGVAEEDVVQVRRKTAEQLHVRDKMLRKLDDTASTHSHNLEEQRRALQTHHERCFSLETTMARLSPMMDANSAEGESLQSLDESLAELKDTCSRLQDSLKDCSDQLSSVSQSCNSLKAKQGKDIEAASASISGLQKDLSQNNARVQHLESRSETMQKYLTGLGRGFQEAHTQLTGDSSALPSKTGDTLEIGNVMGDKNTEA
eukprot:TRINITY_DN14532_c0_g1_i1.p1 TRINITY_DN14532_c0_g1~~TRINITY_DN14532_c0_g1_i1.p1  ORF type:complete len:542 (-),score=131.15 TRINITY_DN14532_c0_g1_i1:127-1722(-)